MNYSQIIDISLPIHEGMIMYPGNPEVEMEEIKSQSSGSVLTKLTFGTHTGTHIDSQKHAVEEGKGLDSIPLETFLGQCRVIDCTADRDYVSIMTLQNANIQKGERILLKTLNSERGFDEFYDDYIYLEPLASKYLAEKEVLLVGIDFLSVKQRGSKDNTPHTYLLEKNIPIIEGIDLSKAEPGNYDLAILPLKFINLDGAPARAVLLK